MSWLKHPKTFTFTVETTVLSTRPVSRTETHVAISAFQLILPSKETVVVKFVNAWMVGGWPNGTVMKGLYWLLSQDKR